MINKLIGFLHFLKILFLPLIISHNLLINNFNYFHSVIGQFDDSSYQFISINPIFINDIRLLINLNILIPLFVITFIRFSLHLISIIEINLILYLTIHLIF